MIWLSSADAHAPSLPAAWLLETPQRPANLAERSALRRGVARAVLARQLGLDMAALAIEHETAGRPVLAGPAGTGLHLSLATRGGVVAVALGTRPLGVDVEAVAPRAEPPLALLHPDERRPLQRLAADARPLAFARLWSAKEAYVKALGTGFLRPPESFAVTLVEGNGFVVADPERGTTLPGFGHVLTRNGGHEVMAAALVILR
jgi:4'-phosphopantetheinyl transferase